jgi:hypothetical protein
MTMGDETEVRHALRRWVHEHSAVPIAADFSDATPLIASRYLTSLQVTDLLLHIEELRGDPLDVGQLRPGVFRDIDSIYATFFAAEAR